MIEIILKINCQHFDKQFNTLLQLTVYMILHAQQNPNKPTQVSIIFLQRYFNRSMNKQNVNSKNLEGTIRFTQKHSLAGEQFRDIENIQILKESAISALIQKQQIIQSLIKNQQSSSCGSYQDLLIQIQELTEKVGQLQMENLELKLSMVDISKQLHQERFQWNQEHFKLIQQIQSLKDNVLITQSNAVQTQNRFLELKNYNQQIRQEVQHLRLANQIVGQQLFNNYLYYGKDKGDKYCQTSNQYSILKQNQLISKQNRQNSIQIDSFSYSKVVFDEGQAQQSIQQVIQLNDYLVKEALLYQTEEWPAHNSMLNSVEEQHCLRGSLKAIKLIDTSNLKNQNISDNQSEFTTKYFIYTNQNNLNGLDKTLSFGHIPQEQEEDFLKSEQKIQNLIGLSHPKQSIWWKRTICFVSGMCTGAYMIWKWAK